MTSDFSAERLRQERIVTWLMAQTPPAKAAGGSTGNAAAERFDTHASTVVLLGERAYKLKHALDVGWMDFSTLEKRRHHCLNELELNRRTAPDLYLSVEPLIAEGEGYRIGGDGEPVEWLLVMRRFETSQRFDRLLQAGELDRALIERLAERVLAFHRGAEVRRNYGGYEGLARVAAENDRDLATSDLVPGELRESLAQRTGAALDSARTELEARREAGFVRRCHGDMHLTNVVLWQGEPTLFDCIEFNEAIGTVDVLYDLAFLLMDLDRHARRDLANAVLSRWLENEEQIPGLALLPLFLSLRAAVRAKVTALGADEVPSSDRGALGEEARDYAERALGYLSPPPPCLLAVGGFSGSGKTSLARRLAPLVGAAPGALLLRSDVVRKRLFGVPPETPLPLEAYTPGWHQKVAETMLRQAAAALAAGHAVLLDAVHGFPGTQAAAESLANEAAVPFQGFWLSAPVEVLEQRIGGREDDASDATAEVARRQASGGEPETSWLRLDATVGLDELTRVASAALPASSLAG